MATVERRKNAWRLIAHLGYDKTGRQIRIRKTVPIEDFTKTEAIRLAVEMESGSIQSRVVPNKMTLDQLYEYWWENIGTYQSPTTQSRNNQLYKRIGAALGHIKIKKLEPRHILAFIRNLREDDVRADGKTGALSNHTIYMHYALIKNILNKAKKWQFIIYNPADSVDPPKFKSKRIKIFQEEELKKFMDRLLTIAPLRYQVFFLIAFTTGLRRSELIGIRLQDIKNDTIYISNATVFRNGLTIQKAPKTEQSRRPVAISPTVQNLLTEYIKIQRELHGKNLVYLFTNPDGKQYHPDSFNTWLARFCKTHGLTVITPHSFRHMSVTYALAQGYDVKQVSAFARHGQVSTTLNIYAEELQSTQSALTNSLDSFIKISIRKVD